MNYGVVIARTEVIRHGEAPSVTGVVSDLPPGTWRVTVHDDGTIERVALYRSMHDRGCQGAWGRCSCGAPRRWVDAEDGAR